MARMTKKLISTIWEWTNICYKNALADMYPLVFEGIDLDDISERDMKYSLMERGLPIRSEQINSKYLEHLRKLTTKQISLVIESHQKGRITRAQTTIDQLLTELLERELASDKTRTYNKKHGNSKSKTTK